MILLGSILYLFIGIVVSTAYCCYDWREDVKMAGLMALLWPVFIGIILFYFTGVLCIHLSKKVKRQLKKNIRG